MNNWKRIVIKVGTSTVCHPNGAPNLRRIDKLCRVISDLENEGHEIILVTSGAIGTGLNKMGIPKRPKDLGLLQAAAAIGQCELMSIYDRFLRDYGSMTGQILLTKVITEDENGINNVITTLDSLMSLGAIPVINENDSIATEEIVYGDNDTLSAVVAGIIKADLLIMLTDTDGLYDKDPTSCDDATLIKEIHDLDLAASYAESHSHSGQGRGGMVTKIHAARIAREHNVPSIITSGSRPDILFDLIENNTYTGTYFPLEENQ